jgi:hypothetical protein
VHHLLGRRVGGGELLVLALLDDPCVDRRPLLLRELGEQQRGARLVEQRLHALELLVVGAGSRDAELALRPAIDRAAAVIVGELVVHDREQPAGRLAYPCPAVDLHDDLGERLRRQLVCRRRVARAAHEVRGDRRFVAVVELPERYGSCVRLVESSRSLGIRLLRRASGASCDRRTAQ